MRRLLAWVTLLMAGLSAPALAGPGVGASVIERVLASVDAKLNLLNIAENYDTDVLASVTLGNAAAADGWVGAFTTTLSLGDADASASQVVRGLLSDANVSFDGGQSLDLSLHDPAALARSLATRLEGIDTTALGAVNTGTIGSTVGAASFESSVSIRADLVEAGSLIGEAVASAASLSAGVRDFDRAGPVAAANIAGNYVTGDGSARVDASVTVVSVLGSVDDVSDDLVGLTTTAIGSLNTGEIALEIKDRVVGGVGTKVPPFKD